MKNMESVFLYLEWRKRMKREICKILCGCMIAGLMAGCGEEPKEKQTDSSVKKEASEVKTAGDMDLFIFNNHT